MKKILIILLGLLTALPLLQAKEYVDSINVGGITGTDTVVAIDKNYVNFGRPFVIEFEYSDLDADDATLDVGTRIEIEGGTYGATSLNDSTFNSYASILGVSFPYTLNVTSNADSYYGKASVLVQHIDRFFGTEVLIKVTKSSVTSGYIRFKIIY